MIKRKGPILAAAVIVAFALGWHRGFFEVDPSMPPETLTAGKPVETAAGAGTTTPRPTAAPEQPARALTEAPKSDPDDVRAEKTPGAGTVSQGPAPDAAPPEPGFDVLRVEPDGSTVVAGRGAANQPIVLTDGSRTLGEAQTDANGDFVMSLSLPAGSHRLQLAQRDDVVSDDAAVVNVPPTGRPDQLLVMMERPGEASEILQRPTEVEETTAPALAVATEAEAPVETMPEQQVAAVRPVPEPATTDTTAGAAAPTDAGLSVEAVEIEGGRLFVAGSAKAASAVRIYLDDRLVAEARSGVGDRFVASASADVAVGDHLIRADVLDAAGRVVQRVEVPFQRPEGTSMAAVAPAPDTGAEPVPAPTVQASAATAANPSAEAGRAPGGITPPAEPASAPLAAAPGRPATNAGGSIATGAAPATATAEELQAVRQPALQAAASRVIIRRGDTLWRISRATYGRGSRYTVIYLANGDQIRDPNRIYPGQVFRMPNDGEAPGAPRG